MLRRSFLQVLTGSMFGLRADLNNDGRVDSQDFAIMADEWLKESDMGLKQDRTVKFDIVPSLPITRPRATYNGKLIGMGMWRYGIGIYDGKNTSIGANIHTDMGWSGYIYGADDIGLIVTAGHGIHFISDADHADNSKTSASITVEGGTVNTGASGGIDEAFVDCGQITGLGRLLMYLEYTTYGQTKNIWYSTDNDAYHGDGSPGSADIGKVWTRLAFSANPDDGSLRHWHGAMWCPGVGENDGKLLLLTGDNDPESALLVCDDVKDLLDNPDVWFSRWGLGENGRDGWSAEPSKGGTPDSRYVVGWGSQDWRICGGAFDPYEGKFYWIPDRATLNQGGNSVLVADISEDDDSSYQILIEYGPDSPLKGHGWTGAYLPGGSIVFNTASVIDPEGQFVGAYDEYINFYAMTADRKGLKLIHKIPRNDSYVDKGRWPVITGRNVYRVWSFLEWDGMLVSDTGVSYDELRGLEQSPTGVGNTCGYIRTWRNLLPNGDLKNWSNGLPDGFLMRNVIGGDTEADNTAEESDFVPSTPFGYSGKSIKFTMGSDETNDSFMVFAPTEEMLEQWRGKWLTFTMTVFFDEVSDDNGDEFLARIRPYVAADSISDYLGYSRVSDLSRHASNFDDAVTGKTWVKCLRAVYVPEDAVLNSWWNGTCCRFYPTINNAAGDSGVIYLADLGIYEGILTAEHFAQPAGAGQAGIFGGLVQR